MFAKGRVKHIRKQMPSLLVQILSYVLDERSERGTQSVSSLCPEEGHEASEERDSV